MPKLRSAKSRRLSKRDDEIIEHTARNRLNINRVIRKLFFDDQQPNAVIKVTGRLCDWGYLQKFPLVHPRKYFVVGRRAAHEFGIPITRTYPLGSQSLPTEYGVLAYATLGRRLLTRLTRAELRQRYETFPDTWLDAPHCLDRSNGRERLELIRVDLGGTPDHVARKCETDFTQRRRNRQFRSLVAARQFRLVVVTGTKEKAAAIRETLSNHVWPDGLELHLSVVPDLLSLIPRGNHAP